MAKKKYGGPGNRKQKCVGINVYANIRSISSIFPSMKKQKVSLQAPIEIPSEPSDIPRTALRRIDNAPTQKRQSGQQDKAAVFSSAESDAGSESDEELVLVCDSESESEVELAAKETSNGEFT